MKPLGAGRPSALGFPPGGSSSRRLTVVEERLPSRSAPDRQPKPIVMLPPSLSASSATVTTKLRLVSVPANTNSSGTPA